MPSFVPIGLKYSTGVSKKDSANSVRYKTSLNVLNGAGNFVLATFQRRSVASKQAQLFGVHSFSGALTYISPAMLFAIRHAIFYFHSSTASTAFLG